MPVSYTSTKRWLHHHTPTLVYRTPNTAVSYTKHGCIIHQAWLYHTPNIGSVYPSTLPKFCETQGAAKSTSLMPMGLRDFPVRALTGGVNHEGLEDWFMQFETSCQIQSWEVPLSHWHQGSGMIQAAHGRLFLCRVVIRDNVGQHKPPMMVMSAKTQPGN